jgi:hypothetical protein
MVTQAALTFDPDTHTFWRDGQRVLSVTQILKRCGLSSPWWTEAARDRGTRVHRALHVLQQSNDSIAKGDLQPDDLPFYEAGRHALDVFGIGVLAAEALVDGGTYAGWLDLRCTLRGYQEPFVIDFKSGRASAWTPLQLAAYAAPQPDYHRRAFIELQANGKPKLTTCHETRGDLRNWHACCAVALLQVSLEIDIDDH